MDILWFYVMEFDVYDWIWLLFMNEFYACNELVWPWYEIGVCMELNLDTCWIDEYEPLHDHDLK